VLVDGTGCELHAAPASSTLISLIFLFFPSLLLFLLKRAHVVVFNVLRAGRMGRVPCVQQRLGGEAWAANAVVVLASRRRHGGEQQLPRLTRGITRPAGSQGLQWRRRGRDLQRLPPSQDGERPTASSGAGPVQLLLPAGAGGDQQHPTGGGPPPVGDTAALQGGGEHVSFCRHGDGVVVKVAAAIPGVI
jgi:hypothetical protein